MAYEKLTVSTAATGLTRSVYETPDNFPMGALVRVEGADIRFRTDGVAPTATDGIVLRADEVLELDGLNEVAAFQAILEAGAGSNATLHVQYIEE